MQDIPTKITGDQLTAAEFTSINNELKNLIENTGIALSSGDVNQIGKAIANIMGSVNFYTDTGGANAYVLNVIGNFQAPTEYKTGMLVRFRASIANTGGVVTVNASSLGSKNVKKLDSTTDPEIGDIPTTHDTLLRYDGTNFIILGNEINNLVVNLLLKTIFSGTPIVDTIQWISNVNNVTDLANTGYGVGRRFNLSDANPLKSAGIAGFAELNNAASVGLAMFLFNSVNFLKVAQLRSPEIKSLITPLDSQTVTGEETFLEAENYGTFIANHSTFTAGGQFFEFNVVGTESGMFMVFAENLITKPTRRFETNMFVYSGTVDSGNIISMGGVETQSLVTTTHEGTTAGVHTIRVTATVVAANLPDGNVYVVKMPMHAGTKL